MKKFKEIHVVSNTHWDREFRASFQKTRMMLVKMIDYLLEVLEKDKDYASYTLDAHSILVEDYLDIRPENRDRIKKLVSEKRLFIGPWYTLPDIPNIGAESIVRNLMFGHNLGEEFGHTMEIGYTPCSWGQTGQLPQIYAGFGIDKILFYRGISPHEADTEFIWESPDGTRALTSRFSLFARYNYYYLVFRKITYGLDYIERDWFWGKDGEVPFKLNDDIAGVTNVELLEPKIRYIKKNLVPAIYKMLEIEGDSYVSPYFLAMQGDDFIVPHPLESKAIKDANKSLKGLKVIHSDLEKYFDVVAKNIDYKKLKVLKGERRTNLKEGMWTYLLPGTLSARTYLKVADFITESKLTRLAEPLASLDYILGSDYPVHYFYRAWRYLLSNHTHDANAGCAPDSVSDNVMYRYRQSQEISDGITEDSIKNIVKKIDYNELSDNGIVLGIFNSLPFKRSNVITINIDVPLEKMANSIIIKDSNNKNYPYQLKEISEIKSFVYNIWNVPQIYTSTRFKIEFLAENIPALGYKTFVIETGEKVNRHTGSQIPAINEMENEFLRVKINQNGTVDIYDKETKSEYKNLCYILDQGEVGNAWRHQSPESDRIFSLLGCSANISLIEDGLFFTSYRADLLFEIPEKCPDEKDRSGNMVNLLITNVYTLKKGVKRLEIKTIIDNCAKDHWLRMILPTGIKTEKSYADSHFDVVERNIKLPKRDNWKEPVVGTYPANSFVDLSDGNRGLAILLEGLREYEVFDDECKSIAISLIRGIRIKLEVSETKKQELPDQGPQCLGKNEFRLAIYPHKGSWVEGNCFREAEKFTIPLRTAQFGKTKGDLSKEFELIKVLPEILAVTCIKKSEKDEGIIIRLFNPTLQKIEGKITLAKNIHQIHIVNLNEEFISELKKESNRKFSFEIQHKKIMTFKIFIC